MSAKKTRHLKQTVCPNGFRTITNSETLRYHCRPMSADEDWPSLVRNIKNGGGASFVGETVKSVHGTHVAVHVIMG